LALSALVREGQESPRRRAAEFPGRECHVQPRFPEMLLIFVIVVADLRDQQDSRARTWPGRGIKNFKKSLRDEPDEEKPKEDLRPPPSGEGLVRPQRSLLLQRGSGGSS